MASFVEHRRAGLLRRDALALIGAGFAAGGASSAASGAAGGRSILGTADQLAAERLILKFLAEPALKPVQAQIRDQLAAGVIGSTPAGAATLDRAIAEWTNSLLFAELFKHRRRPALLWGTDNSPRTWLGHTLPGVGTSGDNPDAIYRTAMLDGSKQYELLGVLDGGNPVPQLVIQVDHADPTQPATLMDMNRSPPAVVGATIKVIADRDLDKTADGGFRMTLGGAGEGPNHIALKPGYNTLGLRDMLADWRQTPWRFVLKEVGAPSPDPAVAERLDYDLIKRNALADLPGYIGFWGRFPEFWFGGLKPNTISKPMGRQMGWGFVSGLRFDLKPDEAFVLTTTTGEAVYTGNEINDPWMIMPDARWNQVSLNNTQAKPSPDGTVTYVVSQTDPGVANWLDTVGVNAGFCVVRWQGLPRGATSDGLIRDARVVKVADVAALDLPRATPEERRRAVAGRAAAYEARLRV